jgi:ketosteroid isomerase-like protein
MGAASVSLIQQLFVGLKDGDAPLVQSLLAPDVRATPIEHDRRELRGTAEVHDWFAGVERDGRRSEVEACGFESHGDAVLVSGRLRAIDGGALWDAPACWLCTIDGGLITSIRGFRTAAEARASRPARSAAGERR